MFRVFEMTNKNINVKFGSIVAVLLVLGGLTAGMGSLSISKGQVVADKIDGQTMTMKEKTDKPKLYAVAPGNWGGTGVNFVIEKKAVTIEFDCADGEITQQLRMDKKGNFKVDGTYTRGSMGPIRMDNLPKVEPVIYEGKISGKVMKYKITLVKTKEVIGEFTVERGKSGRIHRCL